MKAFTFELILEIGSQQEQTIRREVAALSREGFIQGKRRVFAFVSGLNRQGLSGCVLINPVQYQQGMADDLVSDLLTSLGLPASQESVQAASEEAALACLFQAVRLGLVEEADSVLDAFAVLRLQSSLGELCCLPSVLSKPGLLKKAKQLVFLPDLAREVERIQAPSLQASCPGHPVHYILALDKGQGHQEAVTILLSSLYASRRIQRSRYLRLNLCQRKYFKEELLEQALYTSTGGAMVFDLISNDDGEKETSHYSLSNLVDVCTLVKESNQQVLTIICCPPGKEEYWQILQEHLPDDDFLVIRQEGLTGTEARDFLYNLADKAELVPDELLFDCLKNKRGRQSRKELERGFQVWYTGYLRRKVHPQYQMVQTGFKVQDKLEKQGRIHNCGPSGAYGTLQAMIGLDQAKKTMDQVLAAHKARQLYAERGLKEDVRPLHLMFTGNPGTAKTSVARLFARILKEEGLLSRGQLIELGRGDLVGKYVGWTARLVKEWFAKARGSVLFIDEAYALATGNAGSFGQEAIDTLVMEMENCREDCLVILAGYPEQMEGLLAQNPGLRSRIGFHIPFADYSAQEMLQILHLMAKEQGFSLDPDADAALLPWLEKASQNPESGNGRFVRNLLDKARMKQAQRLVQLDSRMLPDKDVATLLACDFEAPPLVCKQTAVIGFQSYK